MNKQLLKNAASAGAAPASIFAACTGFFCDFVKPMINLVPWFLVAAIATSLAIYFFVLHRKFSFDDAHFFATPKGKIFGLSVFATLFFALMIPIFAVTPQQGIAASVSPDISAWQEQILGKLDRIEGKIDAGFEKVLARIDAIDAGAGLVSNPVTSNDFYHNARVQEMNGNLVEAKKAYEEYFKAEMEYVDPYMSYSLILKNLEGKSSARQMMSEMRDDHFDSPSANLAYILMKEDRAERVELLQALTQKNPQYGPAFYYLGREYSYAENGMPTNDERRSEREAFEQVMKLEEDQGVSKFFVDKKTAEENMAFVKQEMKLMEGMVGGMLDNPVDFRIEYVDRSVSISFVPTELVQKIFYRVDEQGEFKDTGSMGVALAGSTTPLPNYQVMESTTLGDHFVEMKYIDGKGKESPVYRHDFTIEPLKIQSPPYKMVDPSTGKEQYMIFWQAFDSSKQYTYHYSVDSDALDQTVEYSLNLTDLSKGTHTIHMQGVTGAEKTNIASMEFEVN